MGRNYEYSVDTELGSIFVVSPDLTHVLQVGADVGLSLSLADHGVSVVKAVLAINYIANYACRTMAIAIFYGFFRVKSHLFDLRAATFKAALADGKLFQFALKTITALLRLAVLQHCLRLRALFSFLMQIGIT